MKLKTPRQSVSYRAARRNAWRQHNAKSQNGPMAWAAFNKPFPSGSNFGIGTPPAKYRANVRRNWYGTPVPPKYMPHIGAKQRDKAALKSGAAA